MAMNGIVIYSNQHLLPLVAFLSLVTRMRIHIGQDTEHNGGSRFEPKPSFVGTPTNYSWLKYKVRSFVQYD